MPAKKIVQTYNHEIIYEKATPFIWDLSDADFDATDEFLREIEDFLDVFKNEYGKLHFIY